MTTTPPTDPTPETDPSAAASDEAAASDAIETKEETAPVPAAPDEEREADEELDPNRIIEPELKELRERKEHEFSIKMRGGEALEKLQAGEPLEDVFITSLNVDGIEFDGEFGHRGKR